MKNLQIPQSVFSIVKPTIRIDENKFEIRKASLLEGALTDKLVWKAVFGDDKEKAAAGWLIWELGQQAGVIPASLFDLYEARGKGKITADFTIPAINLRGLTYDSARAVFSQVNKLKVGAFILEIARSEIAYTEQSPEEYATVIIAAALREGYRGPLFIQGDHFQIQAGEKPGTAETGEMQSMRKLIKEAIEAGFCNIDIDASTLVDLTRNQEEAQQLNNIKYSLLLAEQVRSIEAKAVTVALGGEIGHIGGKKSTIFDFEAYMQGFNSRLKNKMKGLSKVSVQTGTQHGGVVLADGSLANVDVDFRVLADISKVAREKYGLAGAVQHGASTLADELFCQFPKTGAIEIHLSTGFQNLVFDHPQFPKKLLEEIYSWLDKEKSGEREKNWTDKQFHYKSRKKAWGKFKKDIWSMDGQERSTIRQSLEERIAFLFKELNVVGSQKMVKRFVRHQAFRKRVNNFNII